ncbi:MAG TPA: Rdx family protein [Gammaproteobacteria bacterium]|nr:Rdx family protein [Gammaproteobacteria bacterium]
MTEPGASPAHYPQIVHLDGDLLFCRREAGRFPESAELKRLIRDRIAPQKGLGHSDRAERSRTDGESR